MVSDAQEERPDPNALLARIKAEEPQRRGRLKIFLGFAAGVGKTYEMLSEANRRKQRGQDVVIGYVETHGRKGTEAQIGDLEIIPRKKIEYRGRVFEEMDTEAILRRKPQWVVVDELAHTNVPGSERPKRWQDVEYLRDHGISVLTTLNVQHLESLNDTIYDITGIRVRETVPDSLLHDAEIVMVDITPRALIHRLERGEIYPSDKIQSALNNWFREGNLNALREIALREVAQEVDRDLSDYRKEQRIKKTWATKDRIMVCIAPELASMRLLRRGWRIAQRLDADIVAVYVENRPLTPEQQEQFRSVLALADQLKIPVVTLHGEVADQLISYAKEHQITQIVIGHSSRSRFQEFLKGSIIHRLTQELRNIDILIAAPPEDEAL
ncbi:universal stress protein [Chthonomonas calidirosea]|uniref:universal stress protein n=1 Tax=Chthonomonas calidirosea TaxID=454171 RepID=UPI0006EC9024|nr:universal stress protein [Chthonomonas calidirosea]CEK19514.1 osmosensitive K+ channel His kinase sensor [Chthonomonas calidirosea]